MTSDRFFAKVVQSSMRQIDNMTGEQVLDWLDKNVPIFSTSKRPDSALQIVRAHAMRRLDALTS
jgi:hypothetical protein